MHGFRSLVQFTSYFQSLQVTLVNWLAFHFHSPWGFHTIFAKTFCFSSERHRILLPRDRACGERWVIMMQNWSHLARHLGYSFLLHSVQNLPCVFVIQGYCCHIVTISQRRTLAHWQTASSETQGQIVERTRNWGGRRNDGGGGEGGEKGERRETDIFLPSPFLPAPSPPPLFILPPQFTLRSTIPAPGSPRMGETLSLFSAVTCGSSKYIESRSRRIQARNKTLIRDNRFAQGLWPMRDSLDGANQASKSVHSF